MAENISVKQVELELNRLRDRMKQTAQKPTEGQKGQFGEMLKDAINEVNELQKNADEAVEKQTVSGDTTDLHKTMIALQKAEVSFQTMMQVRNKILKAYEEIMRTPV
mgnify:CR=1 FL=1